MKDITIYTDGSCLMNPGPGGWAFIAIRDNEIVYKNSGPLKDTTNNQMELQAVIEALKWLESHKVQSKTVLFTDSRYVQQGITLWMTNWKKNGWKTKSGAVKNQAYWVTLDRLNSSVHVDWQWVKAHHTDQFNICVDNLARDAAHKAKVL